jgi:hypothetical protein
VDFGYKHTILSNRNVNLSELEWHQQQNSDQEKVGLEKTIGDSSTEKDEFPKIEGWP